MPTVPSIPSAPDASDDPARDASDDLTPDHYFTAVPASAAQRRQMRVRLGGRELAVWTAAGLFSSGSVDLGTQVLLRSVPAPPPTGDLLDLGCGWGPVALSMTLAAPEAQVWAVDVNTRAVDLLRRTAGDLGLDRLRAVTPDEVPAEVRFAAIWSNPPIRVGKEALHAMLEQWLARLTPDGAAYLVVQRNLGADSLHRWLAQDQGLPTERAASAKGFRVLRVSRR